MDFFTPLTKEMKLELIKKAISNEEGWKALALSVKNNVDAKNKCIEMLQEIANKKEINLPTYPEDENGDKSVKTIKVNLADLLVQQLEANLIKLDKEE